MAPKGGYRPGAGVKPTWKHGAATQKIRVPPDIKEVCQEACKLIDQGHTLESLRLAESLSLTEWQQLLSSLDELLALAKDELEGRDIWKGRKCSSDRAKVLNEKIQTWQTLKNRILSWLPPSEHSTISPGVEH